MTVSWNKLPASLWIRGFLCAIGIGTAYAFFGNIIANAAAALLDRTPAVRFDELTGENAPFWLFVTVLLAPLLEEFLFRKLLYNKVRTVLPPVVSALIVSAVFGLLHFDLLQGVYAFVLSLLLCLIAEQTCNWYFCAAAHFGANVLSAVLSVVSASTELSFEPAAVWIIGSGLLLAGLVTLLLRFGEEVRSAMIPA